MLLVLDKFSALVQTCIKRSAAISLRKRETKVRGSPREQLKGSYEQSI